MDGHTVNVPKTQNQMNQSRADYHHSTGDITRRVFTVLKAVKRKYNHGLMKVSIGQIISHDPCTMERIIWNKSELGIGSNDQLSAFLMGILAEKFLAKNDRTQFWSSPGSKHF